MNLTAMVIIAALVTALLVKSHKATPALVWPSLLTRRYMSCRNARSEANRFSMTRLSTSGRVPKVVTVLVNNSTERYAGFSRTRGSVCGQISSPAVASRITPSRCNWPR